MKTNTIKPRIDYTQLAAQLDYTTLEQKLVQLLEQEPPKKRKRIGDLLGPIAVRLRELHAKGWTYELLTKQLNAFGVPVKSAALRDFLGKRRRAHRERDLQRSKPTVQE